MPAYGTPGVYKSGLWVVQKGGTAYVVDKTNLPPTGRGWRYYWIGNGSNAPHGLPIINQLANAAADVGAPIPTQSGDQGPQAYDKLANQIVPFWSGSRPVVFKLPKEHFGDVLAEIVGSPLAGVAGITVAGKIAGAGAEAGGAEAGAGGGAAAQAAKAAAAKAAKAATGTIVGAGLAGGDIEKFVVRVLEGLVGVAVIFLGLQALTGQGSGSPVQAVRTIVGTAAKVAK
jgi:hypothetical protein